MDENIYIIIAKKLSGEASGAELQLLEAWLASGEANKTAYSEMQRLWTEADEVLREPSYNTSAAWEKVASKISLNTTSQEAPMRKTMALPSWTKYVVAAAAILLVSLIVWKPLSDNDMISVVADNGNREVVLPDNSLVTLHSGSSLEYPSAFDNNLRHVKLTGQAFFKVTHDETKPFTIDAISATVKVLGTSFNVDCNETGATVVVATGKVQMTAVKNSAQKLILVPGKQGILQNNNLVEKSVTDDNYLFWMTGVLSFENKPLKDIIAEIAKLNKTTIKFIPSVPESVQNQMITISFNHQPIEEILTELCMVSKCKWNKENNIYMISINDK